MHLFDGGRFAEAFHVFIFMSRLSITPFVVSIRNFVNVIVGKDAQSSIGHRAHFGGVDKQNIVAALTVDTVLAVSVSAQDKEAGGDAGGEEELVGQAHNGIDHRMVHHILAHVFLAAVVGGHRPVGHHNPGGAGVAQVVPKGLHPHIVGVAIGGEFVPGPKQARIDFGEVFGMPVAHVKGRIGEDIIGFKVGKLVVQKGVPQFDIKGKVAQHQVHQAQPQGLGGHFLTVDGNIAAVSAVLLQEF